MQDVSSYLWGMAMQALLTGAALKWGWWDVTAGQQFILANLFWAIALALEWRRRRRA